MLLLRTAKNTRQKLFHLYITRAFACDKHGNNTPETTNFQIDINENIKVSASVNQNAYSYEINEFKGTSLGGSGVYMLMFRCTVCDTKQSKTFTKNAYHQGVVLIRCDGCQKTHLIADNLGWFGENPMNIEDIMSGKGESVIKIVAPPELQKILEQRLEAQKQNFGKENVENNKK